MLQIIEKRREKYAVCGKVSANVTELETFKKDIDGEFALMEGQYEPHNFLLVVLFIVDSILIFLLLVNHNFAHLKSSIWSATEEVSRTTQPKDTYNSIWTASKYNLVEPNWADIVNEELKHFSNKHLGCAWHLVINQTHLYHNSNSVHSFWHNFMNELLKDYEIPDVRFHVSAGDMHIGSSACLSASTDPKNPSPAITNWLMIQQIGMGYLHPPIYLVPWEELNPSIVWRGSIGGVKPPDNSENLTDEEIMIYLGARSIRIKAINIARNFTMLDVMLSGGKPATHKIHFWKPSEKGRDLYPFAPIPSANYYFISRSYLILCGIGAAFRTTRHLQRASLLLIQKCKYEEWFLKYMTPWKHYLPLKGDLSNLLELSSWVNENWDKSKKIAWNGHLFFLSHLAREPTKRFIAQYLTSVAKMNITWIDDEHGLNQAPPAQYRQTANFRSSIPNPYHYWVPKRQRSTRDTLRKKMKAWLDRCNLSTEYYGSLVEVVKKTWKVPNTCHIDLKIGT